MSIYYLTVVLDEPEWLGGYNGFGPDRSIITETMPVMTGIELAGSVIDEPKSKDVFCDGFIYDEHRRVTGVYIQVFSDGEHIENRRYELYLDRPLTITLGTAVGAYGGLDSDIVNLTMTLQIVSEDHPEYSRYMKLATVFTQENFDLLFDGTEQNGSYIACVDDSYSRYIAPDEISRKWAEENLPAGYYDIIVYRRCSVYHNGIRIWKNNDDLSSKQKFVIMLDRKIDHNGHAQHPLAYYSGSVHAVCDEMFRENIEVFYDIEKAETAAKKYSEQGCKAAILEWVDLYDMDPDEY